jgi:hypothetical protein
MKKDNSTRITVDIRNSFILGYQGNEIFIEGKDDLKGRLCAIAFNLDHYESLTKNLKNIKFDNRDKLNFVNIFNAEIYKPDRNQSDFFCNLGYPEVYKATDFLLIQDRK